MHLSAREVSSLLGVIAFALLAFQCVRFWHRMTWLEQALGLLLLATIVIGAVGTYNLDRVDAPASGVVWWIIAHRAATIATALCWPALVGRIGPRKHH